MFNPYEPPQETKKLDIPVAECNHLKYCTDCRIVERLQVGFIIFLMGVAWLFGSMLEEVRKYEDKNHITVYERPGNKIERWITWKK